MLHRKLLATTALVLCVSTAFAAHQFGQPSHKISLWNDKYGRPARLDHGIPLQVVIEKDNRAQPLGNDVLGGGHVTFSNLSKDENARFISWYGFTAVSSSSCFYQSANYHYCMSEHGNNALPFTGKEYRATRLGVAAEPSGIDAGIYSATASGLPGKLLDGGPATGLGQILWTKIHLKLNAGQEYFIEVTGSSSAPYGIWFMEDTDMTGDVVDYYHVKEHETYNFGTGCPSGTGCHTRTLSFSSPWHASTVYPETGAAIVK